MGKTPPTLSQIKGKAVKAPSDNRTLIAETQPISMTYK